MQALVPILIGRLPDPFDPSPQGMLRVAEAARRWTEELVELRTERHWKDFLLEGDDICGDSADG